MLKIEQKADHQPISISLREKTKLLTPTFKNAFILAFFLHLSAFTLFHVQPFRINQSHTLFPPVQVNIEIAQSNSAIFADLNEPHSLHHRVEEPEWRSPSISDIFLQPSYSQDISSVEHRFPPSPFLADPLDGAASSWINLDPKEALQEQTPKFYIYGPLSKIPLIASHLQSILQEGNEVHHEVFTLQNEVFKSFSAKGKRLQNEISRLLYKVKVNNHTGRIFWHQAQTSNRSLKSKQQAELILSRLQFKPDDDAFVTEGQIEFFLREGAQ